MDPMMHDAAYWVKTLDLHPHPEGGYYRRTYESREKVIGAALPPRFSGDRPVATSIYYLLEGEDFSALHRIKSDEIWSFHVGSPLVLTQIDPGGALHHVLLGSDPEAGQSLQHVVQAGCWFGAAVVDPGSYSLVTCVVAPGFDFEDFELADRERLVAAYPEHRATIERLTRGESRLSAMHACSPPSD